MKAIRYHAFGGPDVLRLETVPDPPPPGPGEVRVAMRHAGVIPLDWKMRAGLLQAHFKTPFPKIPGREGAGEIESVGAGVTDLSAGDAVCVVAAPEAQGTCADIVTTARENVVRAPKNLTSAQSAALIHAGVCAWICLVETAGIGPGMRVLIHAGAGAIGGVAVQLARHLGADVTATCRAVNTGYVIKRGAHHTIAYDRADFAVECRDMDVVLDLIGGDVHAGSYRVLKRSGCLVALIAAPIEDRSAERGVRLLRPAIAETPERMRQVVTLAEQGIISPALRGVLPLAQAADAHRKLQAGLVTRGRIVLEM